MLIELESASAFGGGVFTVSSNNFSINRLQK